MYFLVCLKSITVSRFVSTICVTACVHGLSIKGGLRMNNRQTAEADIHRMQIRSETNRGDTCAT